MVNLLPPNLRQMANDTAAWPARKDVAGTWAKDLAGTSNSAIHAIRNPMDENEMVRGGGGGPWRGVWCPTFLTQIFEEIL